MHFDFTISFLSALPEWAIYLFSALALGVAADIDDLYTEIKDGLLPEMWTRGHNLVNRIMDGADKAQVNTRAYLVPRWTAPGGQARAMTFDGDSYANGYNPFTDALQVSSIGAAVSFSATQLMQFAARNNKVALKPFMARYMAGVMDQFKEHFECWLNANSNDGIAAILSGVQNTTEYLMGSADDSYGGYLLIDGADYQIIASASFPDTVRAGGAYRILPDLTGLNKRASTPFVQFAQAGAATPAAAITGFVAEDRVVFFGFGNAGFNSLPYHVSHLATGTWQNVSRAVASNRGSRIDGSGAALTAAMVRRLFNDISKYKGTADATQGLIPYCSQEQIVNWLNSAQAIASIQLTGTDGGGIGEIYDRMISDVKVNKKKPLVSNRANPTQFRFIRLSDFVWVTMQEPKLVPNDNGGPLHWQHDSSGNLASAHSIHVEYHGNLAARDVSSQGVVYNLLKATLGS